jgi:hypothetical protein
MLPALAEAVEHEDMTKELAEILSTRAVDVEYEVSGRRERSRLVSRSRWLCYNKVATGL